MGRPMKSIADASILRRVAFSEPKKKAAPEGTA